MEERQQHQYEFGPFCLDTNERVLLRDGRPLPLKPKVYETHASADPSKLKADNQIGLGGLKDLHEAQQKLRASAS